jgi:RNA-binding protein NOB1
MSWAALARKAADLPQPSTQEVVPQRVVAADSATSQKQVKFQNLEKHTATTHDIPRPKKGCLVLDANAFIKGLDDYLSLADVFITTPQVVGEIKDKHSRELLERFPADLLVLDPTAESVNRVVDVAGQTGDLGTLSRTDIRLCALGLDIGKLLGALRPEIKAIGLKINPQEVEVVDGADAEEEEEEEEDEEAADSDDDQATRGTGTAPVAAGEPMPGWGGSDDEGEWITEDNMERVKGFHVRGEDEVDVEEEENQDPYQHGFATATSDYPMQNVLLHLGVPIVGPAGMHIRELRMWLLRCHACFSLVSDTTKQFCPDCGSGNTLKRVSYTINENGEKKLFVNFKHNISKRGTVYTLPKPRGGRNGTNRTLVLREDQLANCGRQSEIARRRAALAAAGGDDDLKGFGERSQRRTARHEKGASSYVKYNVNEKRKIRAARRK